MAKKTSEQETVKGKINMQEILEQLKENNIKISKENIVEMQEPPVIILALDNLIDRKYIQIYRCDLENLEEGDTYEFSEDERADVEFGCIDSLIVLKKQENEMVCLYKREHYSASMRIDKEYKIIHLILHK
ncbi:MAG: hypothetical protein ACP5QH_05975 [Thermoplasmata archaeon]